MESGLGPMKKAKQTRAKKVKVESPSKVPMQQRIDDMMVNLILPERQPIPVSFDKSTLLEKV
jgi:hypothetical protein